MAGQGTFSPMTAAIRCPGCQAELAPTDRFCSSCGAARPKYCSACGAALAPDARFCGQCGTKVEQGSAPDRIIASKVVSGAVTFQRPLCPFPQLAHYKGSGDVNDAGNWVCVDESGGKDGGGRGKKG